MAIYWFKIILPIVLAVMSFNLVKSQVCSENVDLTIIIDCTGDVTAANFILVQQFFHAFVDASNLEITFGTVSRIFFKLHLDVIVLLKVSNIFHYLPVVPLRL